MTKTDIETLIDLLISESNDGAIEIHNVDEFSNNVRGFFAHCINSTASTSTDITNVICMASATAIANE